MLCECAMRLPLFQMLNTQLLLAHVVMETLRNHTQQKLLSYSEKVQTVTLLMCIRELDGTNVLYLGKQTGIISSYRQTL